MSRKITKSSAPAATAATAETEPESTTTATESDTEEDPEAVNEEDDQVLTPLPVKQEAPKPAKKRRDLGGEYRTKNRVSFGGEFKDVGTVLTLTDSEARHYLKFGSIEAVEED